MDDCDEVMNLVLADMPYFSVFNDFDETVTYCRDMFHGRIIDNISMITIDSPTADNHESNLGTGTNGLEDDTGAHTNLHSDQVEGALGFFGNSIHTGDITANISSSNWDHEFCIENESLSNCEHKSYVDDELLSNCDA